MPNKYQEGAIIHSMTMLTMELEDRRYIYYKGKPLHPSFILNMSFSTVLGGLRASYFTIAKERGTDANLYSRREGN